MKSFRRSVLETYSLDLKYAIMLSKKWEGFIIYAFLIFLEVFDTWGQVSIHLYFPIHKVI